MGTFHGKRGLLAFAPLGNINMVSYTIDATADVAETTIMDSSAVSATKHWKDYVAGFKDWTASCELLDDSGGLGSIGIILGCEATLTISTAGSAAGPVYAGSAICTGFSPGASVDGANTVTATFQGVAVLAAT